jgi:molybdopterin-containing oxidoreductase family iron-sulfur binding subunit
MKNEKNERREFLKIAGLTTLLGLGGGAFDFLKPGQLDASSGHAEDSHDSHGGHGKEDKSKVRWAMTIDMRKVDGKVAQKAIEACHSFHNVPDMGNPKDEIKWLWTDSYHHAFTDAANEYIDDFLMNAPFLLLCNHCDSPPCVKVCPTKATYKRPDGIVAMDYHRCIGCRFCMAGCPYGSRSFNWREPREGLNGKTLNIEYPTRMRGVVEKCNFCAELVDKGQLPKCVTAVPDVLAFGNLNDPDSAVRQILRKRASIKRKPELGTKPSVFYLV